MNVSLKNITMRYGKSTVLENLDLLFEDGKLTALLGPSGCGKTTILNIISGVLRPYRGDVYFSDKCVTNVHLSQRNIGYVFQNYALYPNMTAYENLKFPLTNMRMRGMSASEKKDYYDEQIRQIAELLHIEDTLTRYPSELSGGQQQRVALGRAIIRKPDLLLMDEPFANLDRKLSVEMREEVRQIQQQTGVTTIFVTHNQADANAVSDQIILLDKGVVQQIGTPSQLYDHPANLFTAGFFGEHGTNMLDRQAIMATCPTLIAEWPYEAETAVCRPEDVVISDDGCPFAVCSCTRMGGYWTCRLENNGVQLMMLSDRLLPVGTQTTVALSADHLNFYDGFGTRLRDEVRK